MKKLYYFISAALLGVFLLATNSVVMGQSSPSITVIQPNGGESWVVGTSHLISWTDNLTKPVAIILSTDGGLNYSDTLTSSVSGTVWTWDIPTTQDTSSQCMIKIVSTTNSSISATSSAFFAIKATQPVDSNSIIQPNGGEKWAVGTSHLISWTNYVSKAAIQLSTDGGKTFATLPGADSISGSTFTWDISSSQTVSDSCLIKIMDVHDTSVYVKSDSMFSIVATPANGAITLLQPSDTGIYWKTGTQHLISWSKNFSDSVQVVLMNADTVYSTLSNDAYGSGFAWTIGDTLPVSHKYKISVYNKIDASIGDTSNNYFSVDTISSGDTSSVAKTITLVQPDTAVQWAWNTSHLISWYNNFSAPVKIELLKGGNIYSVLAASVSGNGFAWTISNTIPVDTTYKIRVLSSADTTVADTSGASFSVLATPSGGEIKLVQPNGGDQWAHGEQHLISWYDNFTDPVKVELFKGGAFYSVLDSNITDNRYAWAIPDSLPADTNYRVKVLNQADTTIADESDSSFSILAHSLGETITLEQPTGGENWALGEQHLISWKENFTDPVKVELFYQNTFQSVLDSNNTTNRFVWTVSTSLVPDTGYRIKVLNTADTTISDESDSSFTILAHKLGESLTLVQPDGGEQWAHGETHLISWLDNFSDPVKVELFRGGTFYYLLDSSNSGNSYAWKVPDTLSVDTSYRVKVLNTADTTITDESDSSFSVIAHSYETITLEQPNGGEQWAHGEEHLISWKENFSDPVKVELFRNGTIYAVLDSSNTENRYAWTVPDSLPVDTSYRVKVLNTVDTTIVDESDSSFSVLAHPHETMTLVQPNGDEIWAHGEAHLISWSANFLDTVRIDLYHGSALYSVLDSTATDNRYTWNIPDSIPVDSTYKIKILNISDTTIADQSDSSFSIVAYTPGGEVKVIQPNLAGIQWARGTTHLISWTDNLPEPVNIYLIDTIAPTDTSLIASSVKGSTYAWTISDTLTAGSQYKIEVSSSLQPVSDVSDTTFTITKFVPGGTVKVIQPNGGEQWKIGSTHLISWTDNLSEPVNIYLIDTVAPTDTTLIASDVKGSTYAWTISDTLTAGSQYKIEVASSLQPISDVSDSTFSLTKYEVGGTITVEQPNGGGYWLPGSTYLISWTKNFAQNVKVELIKADTVYSVLDTNATGNSLTWTISDTIPFASDYKMKVVSTYDSTIWDESDTTFSITNAPPGGQITVNQPNGGETWYQGTAYLISWSGNLANLNGDNYDILLAHYNASNVLDNVDTLAKNVPPSTYTWTIPTNQATGTNYRIKITGYVLTGVADSSDSYFTISAPAKANKVSEITAYPNPSANFITLKVNDPQNNTKYYVTVYNRYGTLIWKGYLNTQNTNKLKFTTYNLPNGIYFVTLSGGQKQISKMFIVQH